MQELPTAAELKTTTSATSTGSIDGIKKRCIPKKYHAASLEDFENLTVNPKESVFMSGVTGCGKTHLACAIAMSEASTWSMTADAPIRFVSCPDLFVRLRSTFGSSAKETEWDVVRELSSARILILDDLGAEKKSDYTAASLFAIINSRINDCRMTIVTTNEKLKEIAAWERRIASRLSEFAQPSLPDIDRRLADTQ